MLVSGIDHIGIALFDELKRKELSNPDFMYFFNFLNVGIEIKKFSKSFKVICYNWNPDFRILKEVYQFDYMKFKNDKWNRRYVIGDFVDLETAKKCFLLCVKLFFNEKNGDLF